MMYDVIMHRTQLSLEDWQYEALKSLAERQGRSISDIVREVLTKHLRDGRKKRGRQGLKAIEGIGQNPDVCGRDHDLYLYGFRKDAE